MTTEHTPGPWAVTKARPRKVTAGGVLICNAAIRNLGTVVQNKYGKSELEAEANARLIAAAPELLEALENLLAVNEGEGGTRYHAQDIARAAIAKAKGAA